MDPKLMMLFGRVYRAAAGEGGDEGGGGAGDRGAGDRGDDFTPDDVDPAAGKKDDDDEDIDAKDQKDADDEDDKKADDKDEDEGDDSPRGKDGKFAKKDPVIPKARFDELNRKSRERETALTARIAELEKQTVRDVQQKNTTELEKEVDTLEGQYEKHLADGESSKAREVMKQIRLKERQIVEISVEHKSAQARDTAVEQLKVDMLVDKLEGEFPQLSPESDEYDQEVVNEVTLLRTGFERGGLSSTQALAKAVKYVLGAPQKKEAESEKKGLGGGKQAEDRRQAQLKKNLEAAGKQPNKAVSGVDSDKKGGGLDSKTVSSYTEEEFDALPPSTKARLRGDFIEETAS